MEDHSLQLVQLMQPEALGMVLQTGVTLKYLKPF
jgi:hypothetical protein